jgi:hypothetical protein
MVLCHRARQRLIPLIYGIAFGGETITTAQIGKLTRNVYGRFSILGSHLSSTRFFVCALHAMLLTKKTQPNCHFIVELLLAAFSLFFRSSHREKKPTQILCLFLSLSVFLFFDFSFNELLIDDAPHRGTMSVSNNNSTRPNESSAEDELDDDVEGQTDEDDKQKLENGGGAKSGSSSGMRNKSVLHTLLKQIHLLHETNSKLFRSLHETKGKWAEAQVNAFVYLNYYLLFCVTVCAVLCVVCVALHSERVAAVVRSTPNSVVLSLRIGI